MIRLLALLLLLLLSLGCARSRSHKTVPRVDLDRFMGKWYVIAILPNFIEKKAVNGIETYTLNPDGTIGITYTFRQGGPQGKQKLMTPKAKVYNHQSKAEWRVSFFPLVWLPYLIIDLAEDYRYTAIGVPNRKFLWIMSRGPELAESDWEAILANLKRQGYQTGKIMRMPQIWN